MDGRGKSTRCEYDSDEDGEGKPRCTLSAECARQIVYCCCSCYYGLRPCYYGVCPCYKGKLPIIALCSIPLALGLFILILIGVFGHGFHVAVTVDDATLTRFSLVNRAGSTALSYNLSLALIMRSPNLMMTIKHVESQEATFSFDGQAFDRVLLEEKGFEQGPRTRKTLVFHLSSASDMRSVALGKSGMAEFMKQNSTGVFAVEVALKSRVSYTLRIKKCDLEASCPLKLQLVPPGTPPVMFEKVKCNLAHQKDRFC